MARKANDLVMLLGSRGKSRRRSKSGLSGFFANAGNGLVRLLGGSPRSSMSKSRGAGGAGSGLVLAVIALLCFGGGYIVRGYISPATPEQGGSELKAKPRSPGVIEADTEPLHSRGFFVAHYQAFTDVEAKRQAVDLSRYLVAQGIAKARPYEFPTPKNGKVWVVIVYFDGPDEREITRGQLQALQEVPDPTFNALRDQGQNSETGWPDVFPIR